MGKKDGLKYTGGITGTGAWQEPPIPARDLSPDEVEKFGKSFLLETGLYDEYAESGSSKSKSKSKSDSDDGDNGKGDE